MYKLFIVEWWSYVALQSVCSYLAVQVALRLHSHRQKVV